MDDVPLSPHAYNDEFDGPTLDPKWSTTNTVQPIDTVNPVQLNAIVAGAHRYDFNYRPGWLMAQPLINDELRFDQAVTLPTDCTIFARMSFNVRYSAVLNNDSSFGIQLLADNAGTPDTANVISMKLNESDGNTVQAEATRVLASVNTTVVSRNVGPQSVGVDSLIQNACYVLIIKTGTTYTFGLGEPDGNWLWLTQQTHASAMVWLRLVFFNVSNVTPGTMLMGVSFIRFYDGVFLP